MGSTIPENSEGSRNLLYRLEWLTNQKAVVVTF